jgi:6-hydroxynicotinate 3-monooxygenase
MSSKAKFAIIGAGIGGLALAALLSRQGANVKVYEQARQFQRIGAGIQMSSNAMRVLRAMGLEAHLCELGFQPPAWTHRVWDTGEHLADLDFSDAAQRYGAPYLLMHRGDLHAAILSAVPAALIAFDHKLAGFDHNASGIALRFTNGSSAVVDAVIGADGVHSKIREVILGPEKPRFTGKVAHRTTLPTARIEGGALETCTKWWGPDRHLVTYPVTRNRDETYFVTSVPDPDWDVESWSTRGDMNEVRQAFAGFHPEAQRVLAASREVHKWALFERDPLPRWADGPVVLLGDACHPMMPYMAQGGASALEDAAVLARCIRDVDDIAEAFRRYEATRLERTARLQLTSRANTWGKDKSDPTWVYAYDCWQTSILPARASGTGEAAAAV